MMFDLLKKYQENNDFRLFICANFHCAYLLFMML